MKKERKEEGRKQARKERIKTGRKKETRTERRKERKRKERTRNKNKQRGVMHDWVPEVVVCGRMRKASFHVCCSQIDTGTCDICDKLWKGEEHMGRN